jgi:threonine dehydrogenase-like Zn-dependent dehydrogenase
MVVFCPTCLRDVEVRIEDRRESLPVLGENIEVAARVAVCGVCGSDVWSNELDDVTLERAFAEYRRRHGTSTPPV